MNYREYMMRVEDILGKINAADGIREDLFGQVIRELNEISRDWAVELQKETGLSWKKDTYTLGLHKAPPTRLLGLSVALASWLGWVMHEKHGFAIRPLSAMHCWKIIEEAYMFGVKLSAEKQRP